MEDRELLLLGGMLKGGDPNEPPRAVPQQIVRACKTYRQAVRVAWRLRRFENMTQASLAERAELRPQFVSDYLNPDDRPTRRDLPADAVSRFDRAVGNRLVSQWLAGQSRLEIDWQAMAARAAHA